MAGNFHALAEVGKAIEETAITELPKVNRAAIRIKLGRGTRRLEPEQYLPLNFERQLQLGHQLGNPTSGGKDQLVRVIFASGCDYLHAAAGLFPSDHWFLCPQVSAISDCQRQMRGDAAFGEKYAGARFQDG